ncbi:hypothetical protein BGZ54_000360 [Gamsiella multidivaricata]|nr:hypothetical protein BGZ54_000360 [Gamsiella multidivaricata]
MITVRKLGIKTLTVLSDTDRNVLHAKMADKAYSIGPTPSVESYQKADKIVEIAQKSGAQVSNQGKHGPAPALWPQSESKFIMEAIKVSVVPDYRGDNQNNAFLKAQADKIEYSVLIKAVKDRVGKSMRTVESPKVFEIMLESSGREAMKFFGDDKPWLSEESLRKLGEKAVAAAKDVNYVGTGAVEFIMDNTD